MNNILDQIANTVLEGKGTLWWACARCHNRIRLVYAVCQNWKEGVQGVEHCQHCASYENCTTTRYG